MCSLKKLEYGLRLRVQNEWKNIRFFLIAGIFDKPAKAMVLNMKQFNGYYGCTKCIQPGISLAENEKSILNFCIHYFFEIVTKKRYKFFKKRTYINIYKNTLKNLTKIIYS